MSLSSSNKLNILGSFASSIGVLGIFLYFTGWIYRWAYFGFFNLDITRLTFPAESFFFVPLQVFLGDGIKLISSIVMVLVTVILIRSTLALIDPIESFESISPHPRFQPCKSIFRRIHRCWIAQQFRTIVRFLPQPFRRELIVVFWLLLGLFLFAQYQGTIDARRDANQDTSSLPVITLVAPKDTLPLGRYLTDIFTDPSLQGYQIIGDKTLFDRFRGTEINDVTDADNSRTWHLLIADRGWLYLVRTLPANSRESPAVLAIPEEKGDRLMILSPEAAKK